MEEEKQEKAAIDVAELRLLCDAVKELNISKRRVGMYPSDHPVTKASIGKAFLFLQSLFASKGNITLGIARDALLINNTVLDKKNPVLKEFALTLHSKGIAAITLFTTLTLEELFSFQELITEKDTPVGPSLIEFAEKRGLRNIRLSPLDLSKFKVVEGRRKDGSAGTFWEDYISGLMEGRIAGDDMDDIVATVSPEEIAHHINESVSGETSEKACDTVIHSYLERKDPEDRRAAFFGKFFSMVDNLTPELKKQFLTRSFAASSLHADEVERLLSDIGFDDIDRMMKVFVEQSSLLPEGLKNLVDKLKLSKVEVFEKIPGSGISYVDDIKVDEEIIKSFEEDHDREFVGNDYRTELKKMLEVPKIRNIKLTQELEEACKGEIVDRTVSEIMFELLNLESNSKEDYQKLLTSLTGFINGFIETGRFSEIAAIYNNIYSHSLTGTFREEASGMIKNFFRSRMFLLSLIDAFKVWGKYNREGAINLSRIFKKDIITPLFDLLSDEKSAADRRFFLDLLCGLGSDVTAEAAKRLEDERWYIIRNMIYLVREGDGSKFISRIRQFTKHPDERVVLEAVKTLLHFKTPDSISYIKLYLNSKDPLLREQAVRLAGTYRMKEAVPYLIALLGKVDLFGAESYYKISVVKALGEIGDPVALQLLNNIYHSQTLMYRTELENLKIEIFKSLHNYPFQDVKQLLERGLKSKIREIASLSEKLLKSSGGSHE